MTVMEPVYSFLADYRGRTVSLEAVMAGSDRPRKPVLRVMDRLVREGYLREIADNKHLHYHGSCGPLPRDPEWEILSKPVYVNPKSPKRRTVRDRMWQLIRARRRFTRVELQRLSRASLGAAVDFTQLLEQHGYIRQIGKDSRRKVYMLVKDCGPQRPVLSEVNNAE